MPYKDHLPFEGRIGKTYRDSQAKWPEPFKAAEGAPNVVLIVLDDVGFSDIGCYGSEVSTPNMDRLASGGVRYNNFHVTAMCSPTRACLMTGRNAHTVGVGIISEWSNGFPAYQGRITRKAATLPEVLGQAGYTSYATGKWHLTNIKDYGAAGPHGDWPLGRGFARWYGFHGALADQWHPELYEDNHPVVNQPGDNYHLSEDLIDKAIVQIRDHVTSAPDRPFFEYLAFGACHWPHHVPDSYIEKYRGRYDVGWDTIRLERFARQKKLGLIPDSTQLAARNDDVKAWDALSDVEKKAGCLLQETYAAFLEHTDEQIGRLMDYLEKIGQLDNTLFIVVSDNGASSEGGSMGAFNMRGQLTYHKGNSQDIVDRASLLGTEHAYSHYPTGWAQVGNTPLKWYKKDTYGGGVRAPLIMHWPNGMRSRGEIREQFHHAVDVMATVLECAGTQAPRSHLGFEQLPLAGVSMRYSFDAPRAPGTRDKQYFELIGNRAIWHKGWKAVAAHKKGTPFESDPWQLFNLEEDFSECKNRAEEQPERLQQMIELWWQQAEVFGVLPLDDRQHERAEGTLKHNPARRFEFHPGMARIDRLMMPDISDRSYEIQVELTSLQPDTEGVVFSWGSRFAGFVLYVRAGRIHYEYHYTEAKIYKLDAPLPADAANITIAFERTGKNQGRIRLAVDNEQTATMELPQTWWTYGTTAGLTCGAAEVPIADAYAPPFPFTATIARFIVLLDHAVADENEMYRVTMVDE